MTSTAVIQGRVFCDARLTDGSGRTCRNGAGKATPHPGYGYCYKHGGMTPTHLAAVQVAVARDTAQLYGIPREVHPVDGLMEEYWRTAGLVDAYEAMCMRLLPADVVWGRQVVEESEPEASDGGESMTPPVRKTKSGAGINIYVKLLNEERDRFARLGEAILKLDLASRQLEYTSSQVAALVAVLLSPALGLSEDQRRVAARLLRSLDRAPAVIEAT